MAGRVAASQSRETEEKCDDDKRKAKTALIGEIAEPKYWNLVATCLSLTLICLVWIFIFAGEGRICSLRSYSMRKLGDIPICWTCVLFIAARKALPNGVLIFYFFGCSMLVSAGHFILPCIKRVLGPVLDPSLPVLF